MTKKTVATKPKISPVKVNVRWSTTKASLSQIYEAGLEYCFISKDNKQVCPFVLCKDFLQDALMATHTQQAVKIYGFSFDPKRRQPINLERLRIAITNSSDKSFGSKMPSIVDFMNQIEKSLRLIRSRIMPVNNPPKKYQKCGAFILEGSNRWLVSPPMLSMYTLLVRIGCVHKVGSRFMTTINGVIKGTIKPYQEEDCWQLTDAKAGIDTILKHGYAKIFFKDPTKNFPNIDSDSMHHEMGICSYSYGDTEYHVKHWHRDLAKTKKKKEKKGAKT